MTVITNITSVEVDRDEFYMNLIKQRFPEKGISILDTDINYTMVTEEHIKGRKIHAYGQEFVIGISSDVSRKLGMLMEVFSNLEARIEASERTVERLKYEVWNTTNDYNAAQLYIAKFESASIWRRFKFLFTGNI